jgi:hypothetical protein
MTGTMLGGLTRALTFANVCSALALVVALGTGGAYAVGTVSSHDIKNKSIRSVDIKDGQVKTADLHAGAVDGSKVGDGSIANLDLANDAVNSAKVADNSLGLTDLVGIEKAGTVSLSGIANGRCTQVTVGLDGAELGQAALIMTDDVIQNGIVLYAQRVKSAGLLEVDACNFSGGAMTSISDLPVRVFTFG